MISGAWQYYRERGSDEYLLARRKPHSRRSTIHEAVAIEDDGAPPVWTVVSGVFLRKECDAVAEVDVPAAWRERIEPVYKS